MIQVDRASGRTQLSATPSSAESRYEGIAVGVAGKQMLPFVVYPSSAETSGEFREHGGDELIIVHRGTVELQFPDQRVTLNEGDSAYFKGGIPHRFRSIGDVQASMFVVINADDRSTK